MRSLLAALVLVSAATLAPAVAEAASIGLPLGARQWVLTRSFSQCDSVVDADCVGGIASASFSAGSMSAGGSSTANSMVLTASTGPDHAQVFDSLFDTYTVTGPVLGAPVSIDLSFEVTAEGSSERAKLTSQATVGVWNGNTDVLFDETQRVQRFDATTEAFFGTLGFVIPPNSYSDTVTVSYQFDVLVGDSFDVGYSLDIRTDGLTGGGATATTSATIDFDLPAGIGLNSVLGWQPVPEPGTATLFAIGILGLATGAGRAPRPG